MSRNDRRRNGRGRNWNNRDGGDRSDKDNYSDRKHENRGSGSYERRQERRRSLGLLNQKEIEEKQNAIRAFKENVIICEICGQPITDIANAISNKDSSKPVHFDCVLNKITEMEKPGQNEKVAYIGQGKFALLHYDNPHDQKHFEIKKTIEWEGRDSERGDWRDEMATLYSQVK